MARSPGKSSTAVRLEGLLREQGLHIKEAAGKLKISPRRAYQLAERHRLPTNALIVPGGSVENQVIRALVITRLDVVAVGKLFGQAPCRIKALMDKLIAEAKRFSGLEKSTRLGMLAAQRHQELEASKVETRKEKFPGQSTAYLVGANR